MARLLQVCQRMYGQDLDGNKYIDMTMGVGTNILGYANRKVNNAVINVIKEHDGYHSENFISKKTQNSSPAGGVNSLEPVVKLTLYLYGLRYFYKNQIAFVVTTDGMIGTFANLPKKEIR